ncbi:sulfoxide reductase heme-binding subunit YedZ [Chloroflexales bacterium ZM16-3]|nr:sulfoxide reductase heme-binding subunit YedZ [Chloroflexales bacterium ZM16-3]
MRQRLLRWLRVAVHIGSLAPLALLISDIPTVNPIQAITQHSGRTAIILLMLCLACTPLNLLFGWKWAASLRKPLGLYSFLYVCLHLLTFAVLDYGLDGRLIWQAVLEKRYVVAGFSGFLLLLPLAITSTKGWQRRLGRRWRALHSLIYPAAILAILHFLWLSKVIRDPLIYGAIVAALLIVRLPPVRSQIAAWRRPARRLATLPGEASIE